MQKLQVFILVLFLIGNIVASCEDNQIDINSASLSELDALSGIGPAKAQAIIDARPYESVDDLTNAYGIGAATLEKIKTQGLACVEDEKEVDEKTEEETEEEIEEVVENEVEYLVEEVDKEKESVEKELIDLSPKDIKTEENTEDLSKSNYSIYGLLGFGILIGVLFLFKGNKKYKSEFK